MSASRLKRDPVPESRALSGIRLPLASSTPGIPYVDETLIMHLMQTFKVSVSADYSIREYDRMVGQQEVIAHLSHLLEMIKKDE
jgi:hypothetical protein